MKARPLMLALSLLFISACLLPRTWPAQAGAPQQPGHVFTKNTIIYVSDFELDTQNLEMDKGGIVSQVRPGILERPRKREQHDPEAQAKKLVDLMSKSIVSDLHKAGYQAQRLEASEARPASGAWVRGVFTEVDEGNRVHRAILGFGSGEAKMDLYVTLSDLASPEKPLYDVSTTENSGKKIGAAITMNPYIAAAKFIMEKNAPEKTVKETASQISADVVKRLKTYETSTQ
jgi:Domain of unknown function (DUF4410)